MQNEIKLIQLRVLKTGHPNKQENNIADRELVARLSRQTFYDTYCKENSEENMAMYLESNFNNKAIELELSDPKNTFIIAEENDIALGYAKLHNGHPGYEPMDGSAMEISRIYVVQNFIGKGVGKALVEQCIEISKKQHKKSIWLGVWKQNSRAIKFYKNFGFLVFSTQVFMLGNDAQEDYLMKREI